MNNLAQTHSALSNLGENLSQLSPANTARALAMMTLLFSGSTAAAIDSRAPSETLLTPAGSEVLLLAETRIRGTRELGEALLREGQRYIDAGEQNISRGQAEIEAGQAEIEAGQAEIEAGQAEIEAGQAGMRNAQAEIAAGQEEIRAGQEEIRAGQEEIRAGQAEIRAGQEQSDGALENGSTDMANKIVQRIKDRGWDQMGSATLSAAIEAGVRQLLEQSELESNSSDYNEWSDLIKLKVESQFE